MSFVLTMLVALYRSQRGQSSSTHPVSSSSQSQICSLGGRVYQECPKLDHSATYNRVSNPVASVGYDSPECVGFGCLLQDIALAVRQLTGKRHYNNQLKANTRALALQ
ncbi:hypothetical protein B0J12DRAFT_703944 [Macrophomina phaseolina]|uniref:Uncharacterized protein n=1 Tax=Macrophomina phaseolina TaxID=35725 RepID=A0ABQ8FWZ5_9PEZI|nr:hypothetical protein B0J12DRAFT_703944 [Macrophomina phaseolina]